MIKVIVELWPYGDEASKKVIAESRIWNSMMNDGNGSYLYGYDITTGGVKEDKDRDVMHLRKAGIWELIRTVLNDRQARKDGMI